MPEVTSTWCDLLLVPVCTWTLATLMVAALAARAVDAPAVGAVIAAAPPVIAAAAAAIVMLRDLNMVVPFCCFRCRADQGRLNRKTPSATDFFPAKQPSRGALRPPYAGA